MGLSRKKVFSCATAYTQFVLTPYSISSHRTNYYNQLLLNSPNCLPLILLYLTNKAMPPTHTTQTHII